jgi:hypothetical protein
MTGVADDEAMADPAMRKKPSDLSSMVAWCRTHVVLVMVLIGALMVSAGAILLDESAQETRKSTKTTGHLWWAKTTTTITHIPEAERRMNLLMGVGWLIAAAVVFAAAAWLFRRQRRSKRYQAILTGIESMDVQRIAGITGDPVVRVRREIQHMIDSEAITDIYIDYEADRVISKKYIPKMSHKTVVVCTGCGARNELIVGITKACDYCGDPLVLSTA